MLTTKRILALDMGSSRIVVAEFSVSKTRGVELLNYGITAVGADGDNDEISKAACEAVRVVMHEHGIRPAPLIMCVSGQAVFPRFVKLPPVARDKVSQIVQYEAEQNVPFPIDEVVWDYTLVEGDEGDLNVMLVAAKIENVRKLTDCVLDIGMEPETVDAAPMALYNAVRYNYPDEDGCVMVLDIGARSSNLIFVEESRIFSRSIPVAGVSITQELAREFGLSFEEAEELKREHAYVAFGGVYAEQDSQVAERASKIVRNVVTRLHAEVNRSINFYRSQQGGTAPSRVLLTGGTSILPHLDTFFAEKLGVEVEFFNPFINIPVNERIDADRIEADMQVLGTVAGMSLRRTMSCPVEIDLLPPDLVAKKVFRKRVPYLVLSVAGVVMIMLCWWVYLHQMGGVLGVQSQLIEDRISVLNAVQGRLETVLEDEEEAADKLDSLTELVALKTQWIEIMDSIHDCMIEGMWLRQVDPVVSEEGIVTHIEISGVGFVDKVVDKAEISAIEELRDRLREREVFTEDTQIRKVPPVGTDAFAREFVLRAGLKDPMRLR